MAERKLRATLTALHEAGVEFILVGGLSAVMNGAPINTYDVDVVHARDAENVARLLPVLDSFGAISRIQPERRLKPNASHLSGPGHLNLLTKYGPLDLETLIAIKEELGGRKGSCDAADFAADSRT